MATITHKATIGSISSGTLRGEDLLPEYAWELKRLAPDHPLVKASYDLMAEWGEDSQEELDQIDELVNDIQEALQEFAPVFCYFGSHPGDGADFGFWPDTDAIDDAIRYGEKQDDGSILTDDGYRIVVSDHGNVEFYDAQGNSILSVV